MLLLGAIHLHLLGRQLRLQQRHLLLRRGGGGHVRGRLVLQLHLQRLCLGSPAVPAAHPPCQQQPCHPRLCLQPCCPTPSPALQLLAHIIILHGQVHQLLVHPPHRTALVIHSRLAGLTGLQAQRTGEGQKVVLCVGQRYASPFVGSDVGVLLADAG